MPAYEDIAEGTRYKQWRVNCACQLFEAVSDGDSLDWKDYGSEAIAAQILNECEPESGSILQFRGGAKYTAAALEPILSGLQGLGLSATTVSGLFPDS